MYNNGSPRPVPDIHTSDLVGRRSVRYIRQFAASEAPVLRVDLTGGAPRHERQRRVENPVPAPRHRAVYLQRAALSLSNPAFNEPDLRDKSAWVQARPVVHGRA